MARRRDRALEAIELECERRRRLTRCAERLAERLARLAQRFVTVDQLRAGGGDVLLRAVDIELGTLCELEALLRQYEPLEGGAQAHATELRHALGGECREHRGDDGARE